MTYPRPDSPGSAPVPTLSLASVLTDALQHWRLLIGLPFGFAVLLVLRAIFGGEMVASSRFAPQSAEGNASQLSAVAAQFGFSFGLPGSGESVHYYAQLLRSRDILRAAAETRYRFPVEHGDAADTMRGTLVELLRIEGDTPEQRVKRAIRDLDSRLTVTTDIKANTVALSVVTPWPALSEQVNRRLLDLLNDFNLRKRQAQAGAEAQLIPPPSTAELLLIVLLVIAGLELLQ